MVVDGLWSLRPDAAGVLEMPTSSRFLVSMLTIGRPRPANSMRCSAMSVMGMVHQGLAPGVQHGDAADSSAEMLRVGGDGPEASCGGSEQGAVDFALVVQRQRRQLCRQGEDDVEIGDRQQILAAVFQPLGALLRLALRTVAIAAGVVRYAYFTTAIAGIDVAAKLGGTTGCKIAHDALPACDTRKPGTRPSAAARERMTSATSNGGWCTGSSAQRWQRLQWAVDRGDALARDVGVDHGAPDRGEALSPPEVVAV